MPENNIIKSIVESYCPHCNKQIYIESQFKSPIIGELFTKEKMEESKKDCLARIETLTLDDDKKNQVIKWINNENTIFSPSEVESIILSLVSPEKN